MAMLGVAVYDALNGINRTHWPYHVTALAPAGASKDAAVSAAAKAILDSVYTGNATALATIDTRYTTSLAAIPDSQAKTDGIAWGTAGRQRDSDAARKRRFGTPSSHTHREPIPASGGRPRPPTPRRCSRAGEM